MKIVLAAAILASTALLAGTAWAADYPVSPHPGAVRFTEREPVPVCYRKRFAYFHYAPILATEYMVRSVWVTEPVPCDRYR